MLNMMNIIAAAPAASVPANLTSSPAAAANGSLLVHYTLALLAVGAVLYAFRSISRAADASPLQMILGLLRASRTVLFASVWIVGILGTMRMLAMSGLPINAIAKALFDGVACGIAVIATFFIIRQFAAPPWWRLNAWNPATDTLGERGSLREAAMWILGDARLGLLSMRLRDRIIVCVGMPAIATNLAWMLGFERMLQLAFGLLLVLYVALAVALMTANRIPRVLMSRLVDLRHVARRIASGDLGARASTHELGDYEELGDLVSDLNTMARALQLRDSENRTLHERLTYMLHTEQELATRDALTGLRNRRYFVDSLRAELDRSGRTGATCAVAIIDLDNFKQVNDRFGHQEGDAVLQRTAHALVAALRPYDLACRLGGEEFGVIFPQTRPEEAQVVLDRIMHSLGNAGPQQMAQTFSGGIASFPEHARDDETLYRLADEAAYDAKLKGKARNVLYDPVQTKQMDSPERQADKRRADMVATAKALVATVDAKESMSRNHSETVGRYAKQLALALGNDGEFAEQMYLCGILHDVGKIGLSETIMNKPGRLTAAEFEQVK
ncbi:MAG: diguanylate cyclase, partial [Thermoleophilia bacterium]|nr:diguanylate cyclase [Thermoleophilia bacterium]